MTVALAPRLCCTEPDVKRDWLLRFGQSETPDLIGCEDCVRDEFVGAVRRASLEDIADGNVPEVRRVGTFKVGDHVRYVGDSSDECYDVSLDGETGVVVDRSQWPFIDAPDGHDIRIRMSSGIWSGHYADCRPDELELVS